MSARSKKEKNRLKPAKKKKPPFRYTSPYGEVWDSSKPLAFRIIRLLLTLLMIVVMIGAIIAIIIRVYRTLTHK